MSDIFFRIRRFRAEDTGALLSMIRKLSRFHGEVAYPREEHLLSHALGRKKTSYIWIAMHKGEPAGFIEMTTFMNYTCGYYAARANLLFIEKKYRRMGLGTHLIKAAVREALKQGCDRFDIGAATDNRLSNSLYRKLKFEQRIDRHNAYRATIKQMHKLARTG